MKIQSNWNHSCLWHTFKAHEVFQNEQLRKETESKCHPLWYVWWCHILQCRWYLGVNEVHFTIKFTSYIVMTPTPWWPGRLGCPFSAQDLAQERLFVRLSKRNECVADKRRNFWIVWLWADIFCFTFLCFANFLPPSFYDFYIVIIIFILKSQFA